jgi:cytochrome d ubiquinol oxidase subunit I
MLASVVTASFVVAAIGAFWTLKGLHAEQARLNLRVGTILGCIFSILVAFPTGDLQGKLVAKHQPITLAAMEGRFESGPRAGLTLVGEPNVAKRKIENPIKVPAVLSFIAYGTFSSNVKGLLEYPEDLWPQNIELLYYSFHIMAGLGTLMIAVMALAVLLLWRGRLEGNRPMLWVLMLAFPFPYIATTAGWAVAEFGRQPWLIYGLLRTAQGGSPTVHAGYTAFTTLGFAGIFVVLSILVLFLIGREIAHGPAAQHGTGGGHA